MRKHEPLKGRIFYDNWYTAQLARPNLNNILQGVYRRAKLVVVFLSPAYYSRYWCRIEWRVIQQRLYASNTNDQKQLMLVKLGSFNKKKLGIEKSDGYLDAENMKDKAVAQQIFQKWQYMNEKPKTSPKNTSQHLQI